MTDILYCSLWCHYSEYL